MFLKSVPITGRKIRFALVGCGRISGSHVKAIEEHSANAECVAVCDNKVDRVEAVAQQESLAGEPETRGRRESPVGTTERVGEIVPTEGHQHEIGRVHRRVLAQAHQALMRAVSRYAGVDHLEATSAGCHRPVEQASRLLAT